MSPTLLLLLFAAAAAIPLFILVSTHNRLVALDGRCETAFADIDVLLKHRQNLIPSLVETVRGFASHESNVLLGLAKARADAAAAISPDAKLRAEKNLTQNIHALMSVVDKYPELQASGHFTALRDELVAAENRITAARRFYNLAVGEYGATLRQFPGSFVGRFRRFDPRGVFDLGIERVLIDEPVAIKF